ncbi:amidohydrolase [Gemmata sp. G18]|uniref:Amidohydrolase n=1 Tax=Gemmata palustris TaxID=2822762 RepID=A0ABS5C411_9BACT|nr:amidohydrolase family protein [Gemmata palustris]MBP3960570.1 amidohydrolase [Gemmata palustris]
MIDVHIHAVPPNLPGVGSLSQLLRESPERVASELRREMQTAGVSHAFAMGAWSAGDDDPLGINRTLEIAPFVPGLRPIGIADPTRTDSEHFRKVELILASGVVVALKGYLGYLHFEPAHPNYQRYYELAAKYRVPVMFHTGDTYSPQAKLKYAHPLGVDEVAVDHPECRFVMCHLGNPWMTDAAEVIYKNVNVWADLSGLLVGDDGSFASEEGREAASELAHGIRRAMKYSERPNRFLYGTDWPLAPMAAYREFVREAVAPEHHEQVFEENARRLFRLG